MHPKVDEYLKGERLWPAELHALRRIVLECQLTEEYKWRQPCYTFRGKNVLMIGEFKQHAILSFIKGALLKDEHNLLDKPGKNSQAGRWMAFTDAARIEALASTIKAYIFEAVEIEKAGLKVETPSQPEAFAPELTAKLQEDSAFNEAFTSLTPGKQRAYNIYFTGAKQPETRKARIERYTPRILHGFGFHDCVCGHSKRKPRCDGSHKNYPNSRPY